VSETALLEQVTAEIVRDYAEAHPTGLGSPETADGWAPALWKTLDDAGLPLVGLPEAQGGAGGGWPEIAAVVRAAARYAAPVPLAETCALAGWLLTEAGLPVPAGPLTVAPTHPGDQLRIEQRVDGWQLDGHAARVPWASQAGTIVVLARHGNGYTVASVPAGTGRIEPGANLAGEPRDHVTFEDVRLRADSAARASIDPDALLTRGALVRSIQIAGALDRVLELTVAYVQARSQFGRPLGRFQAVQQELARLAGEAVASRAAVESAVLAAGHGACTMDVAAAKIRTGEAASVAARIAHQLHGAIGYTREHQLHRLTTRLWSWRDELGAERDWAIRLGTFAAGAGPVGYWDWFTRDATDHAGGTVR
jgi:acyl-CoA dehydrogenase